MRVKFNFQRNGWELRAYIDIDITQPKSEYNLVGVTYDILGYISGEGTIDMETGYLLLGEKELIVKKYEPDSMDNPKDTKKYNKVKIEKDCLYCIRETLDYANNI